MSRRIPLFLLDPEMNKRHRQFMLDSVVGGLVTEGGRLNAQSLIELLMPCTPPVEALIERAVEIIKDAIINAEAEGMVVVLGRRVLLTTAGMARGAYLFGEIVKESERGESEEEGR